MKLELMFPLWDAINRYALSVRGRPDKYVYGNGPRMDAVAKVDALVRLALNAAREQGRRDGLEEAAVLAEQEFGFEEFPARLRYRALITQPPAEKGPA